MHDDFGERRRARFLTRAVVLAGALLVFGCQGEPPRTAVAAEPGAAESEPSTETKPADNASGEQPAQPATPKAQPKAPAREPVMTEHPFPRRIAAPSFPADAAWLNTAGPIDLEKLRGKFVLLDFWTYCCINCMHILPELKKLEHAYPNEIVVIGVHTAKFDTEKDTDNIRAAAMRYEIEHPIVNDAEHRIWDSYFVNSWPSLRIIDPQGQLIAGHSGETTFEELDRFFKHAIPYYRQRKLIDETPLHFELAEYGAADTPLRYPGKVLADPEGGRLFIADSNHNRIVVASLEGKLLDTIGSGEIGQADGSFSKAQFNKPQGMVLHGAQLYVADTENHLLRRVDLEKKDVHTIAGMGEQWRGAWPGLPEGAGIPTTKLPTRYAGKPLKTGLNSPWALLIHEKDLYIAMAGPHQIWRMPLDGSEIGPFAGNGREDIVDGPLLPSRPYELGFASFAQPSGLATDGKWLYVADSEGSSIRAVPFDRAKQVKTVVGTAHLDHGRLFDFGDIDGDGFSTRLQHPLGVAYRDGQLYVADTYNNKIKAIDLKTTQTRTLVGANEPGLADDPPQFDEPAGLSIAGDKLYVADTNNHVIRVIDLAQRDRVSTLTIQGLEPPRRDPRAAERKSDAIAIDVPALTLKPVDGAVRLTVKLKLPQGWKINPIAPMRYIVTAEGAGISPEALGKSTKIEPATEFSVSLSVTAPTGKTTVQIELFYYDCQEGAEGLCKAGRIAWRAPLSWNAEATETVATLEHSVP